MAGKANAVCMLTVACCLWDANDLIYEFSRCFDSSWVDKLYRGFARNLTVPFRFVCFTDRKQYFREPVESVIDENIGLAGYGDCIRPFSLNEPMIFVGLDTIVTGNIDKMARWCVEHPGQMALPKHPYEDFSINGVVLCGAGMRHVWDEWRGENDMEWTRSFPHERIDDLWDGRVVSYKAAMHGEDNVPLQVRIVYFHGKPKPHQIRARWVREHWR